MQVLLV